jgi:hypothetical protein
MALSVGYEIRVEVRGVLPSSWTSMFGDVAVTAQPDGTSLLIGRLPDQAAVHGLLGVIRDLGLSLIAAETRAIPQSKPETGGQS